LRFFYFYFSWFQRQKEKKEKKEIFLSKYTRTYFEEEKKEDF